MRRAFTRDRQNLPARQFSPSKFCRSATSRTGFALTLDKSRAFPTAFDGTAIAKRTAGRKAARVTT